MVNSIFATLMEKWLYSTVGNHCAIKPLPSAIMPAPFVERPSNIYLKTDDPQSTPNGNLVAGKSCRATAYLNSRYTDSEFINTTISISSAVAYFTTPTGVKRDGRRHTAQHRHHFPKRSPVFEDPTSLQASPPSLRFDMH